MSHRMQAVQPQIEPLLRRLVAADSSNPPGDERSVAAVILASAQRLRLPRPLIYSRSKERPNLIFELGGGSPTLFLGAHMDTVPAGEIAAWRSDPLELTIDGDHYRGLGVADMKGAIAALLLAAAGLELPSGAGRVLIGFTADEEGAADYGLSWLCSERLFEADAAVLLEPASISERSWDGLYIAQRGSCVVRIEAHGEPGHSGYANPATTRAGTVFTATLAALSAARPFSELKHPLDGTPPLVSLPTMVSGGITPWQHPSTLSADAEIRTIPGMTPESVTRSFQEILRANGLGERVSTTIESWSDPVVAVEERRLLDACVDALTAIRPSANHHSVFPATTDATFLTQAGIPTIPALGPGSLRAIHQPNERLPREDLPTTVNLVWRLIEAYFSHN